MGGEQGSGLRQRLLLALLVIVLASGAGVGTYFIARSGGEDLERARAHGRAAGERAGAARGAERGNRKGFADGRRAAYRASYRRTRGKTIASGKDKVAAAQTSRSCGDLVESGAGTYDVQSVDVICDIALQVARQWEGECASQPSGSCTVRAGFTCNYRPTGYELGSTTCTEGSRRVDFVTGS